MKSSISQFEEFVRTQFGDLCWLHVVGESRLQMEDLNAEPDDSQGAVNELFRAACELLDMGEDELRQRFTVRRSVLDQIN